MSFVYIIALLAVIQFFYFGVKVGRARAKYGINAPAVTGNEIFERFYRVQMNTLEQMAGFLPALLISAQFWSPWLIGCIGLVYLAGRLVYSSAYVANPKSRDIGFLLTVIPTGVLLLLALTGAVLSLF